MIKITGERLDKFEFKKMQKESNECVNKECQNKNIKTTGGNRNHRLQSRNSDLYIRG